VSLAVRGNRDLRGGVIAPFTLVLVSRAHGFWSAAAVYLAFSSEAAILNLVADPPAWTAERASTVVSNRGGGVDSTPLRPYGFLLVSRSSTGPSRIFNGSSTYSNSWA